MVRVSPLPLTLSLILTPSLPHSHSLPTTDKLPNSSFIQQNRFFRQCLSATATLFLVLAQQKSPSINHCTVCVCVSATHPTVCKLSMGYSSVANAQSSTKLSTAKKWCNFWWAIAGVLARLVCKLISPCLITLPVHLYIQTVKPCTCQTIVLS